MDKVVALLVIIMGMVLFGFYDAFTTSEKEIVYDNMIFCLNDFAEDYCISINKTLCQGMTTVLMKPAPIGNHFRCVDERSNNCDKSSKLLKDEVETCKEIKYEMTNEKKSQVWRDIQFMKIAEDNMKRDFQANYGIFWKLFTTWEQRWDRFEYYFKELDIINKNSPHHDNKTKTITKEN